MIGHLARWKFIDQTWTVQDLDLLAGFWVRLCRDWYESGGGTFQPQHALELRLTGFPRAKAGELQDALTGQGLRLRVQSPTPEALVMLWDPMGGDDAPPKGLGLSVMADPRFGRLIVGIRFAVASGRRPLESTTTAGFTLAVVGELRDGALAVKALWGGRAAASQGAIYNDPTPWEHELLAGFDRFRGVERRNRRKDEWLLEALPYPPKTSPLQKALWSLDWERLSRMYARVFEVPFGRPRLAGLLARLIALAALLGGGVFAIAWLHGAVPPQVTGMSAVLLCVLAGAFVPFLFVEFSLLVGFYSKHRTELERMYRRPDRYARMHPDEAAIQFDDPASRKATADLEAAGLIHLGDVASLPHDRADTCYRVFYAPDGITYLVLCCTSTFHTEDHQGYYWPAHVGVECQTFFDDGSRVDSANHLSRHATRVVGSKSRLLAFPEATDPLALLQLHTAAATEFARETASTPVRHEPLEQYARRQEIISEEECEAYAKRPYSRREHLRWYLQLGEPRSSPGVD